MDFLAKLLEQTGIVDKDIATLIVHVCVILLAVIIFNFILRRVFTRLEKGAQRTRFLWDDAVLFAARPPISCLVWVVSLAFAAQLVEEQLHTPLLKAVPTIRTIGVIACFAWFLVRMVRSVQNVLIKKKAAATGGPVDRTTIDAVCQILRILIIAIAGMTALQSLGYSISAVWAAGGVGGIAIGFAAKDMLANFFGGLMIHLDHPFTVGDWIRSSEKQIEGTVEEVGWRVTRIRTFDARPLYVPNSIFTTITVENPSRMTNRRIQETIGIRYDDIDKIEGIVTDIRSMLRNHPEIDQKQTLIVNFLQFNEYSLDIMIYTFTRTTVWVRYHEVKQHVLLQIADIIKRHGAEIAFPTRISYSSPLPTAASKTPLSPLTSLAGPNAAIPPAPYDDDDDAGRG